MTALADKIAALPSLRLTVDSHRLMAQKALGQNFLLDQNITDKIIHLSLQRQNLKNFNQANVFEVGPGPGGLTRAILKAEPQSLTVIEMDERCIAIMNEIREKTGDILHIINGDAMQTDIESLSPSPRHIISNLPYNISVPLLVGWLKNIKAFNSLTLMFQKEVAERITAPIKTKDYGRISVLSQLQCKIDHLMDLNPECFTPAPKIWSSVLLFRPLEKTLTAEQITKIEKLTTLAFGQRRKMIRQSLKSIPDLEEKCLRLNIPLTARAEELTPQQFLSLAKEK